MRRWLLYHQGLCWLRIGLCVKFAIKGFKEIRICSFIGGVIICLGSLGRDQVKKSRKESTCAPNLAAFITVLHGHWAIWPGSRSISAENMVKRSGNARNAQKIMPFNLIGRHTRRYVDQESINVIVGLCFWGPIFNLSCVPYRRLFWSDFDIWSWFRLVCYAGGIVSLHTWVFVMH